MSESAKSDPTSLSERVRSLRLTETSESTSGGLWWLPWAICAVLFLVAGALALEAFSSIDDDLLKKLAEERGLNLGKGDTSTRITLPGVSAGSVSESDIALEAKGYIVPIRLIQVSPKVSGTVMKLELEEGKYVKKGVVLAKLEDIEYEADFRHASAAVKVAQARVDELKKYRGDEIAQAKADMDDARAQYDQALAKYNRTVELRERVAVSAEDLEAAKFGFESMKSRVRRFELAHKMLAKEGPRDARIAAAESERNQAEANLTKAKWKYENAEVKAPITGVILSKKTEEGNIVNPSAFSNGLSASLCEMANLYEMEVDLSIAERDISKVFKGQECRIRAEAFVDRYYSGYVSRIMPMADRAKSAVPVRVMIQFPALDAQGKRLPMEAQGEFLRPEMGAIVTFLNRKR
ncbi:MAG: efflux RND transporter periplasmic adaptor subunit [Planctomycetes bacterium]|nr:efflux RND transporter periplasmic adaptor subunit [Planctomycetota bacterium]